MKKYINLFLIIMTVFCFSTCDFQLPTGIEINGTFENSIPAKLNVGALFTDKLEESFEDGNEENDLSIYNCTATDVKTILMHLNLFEETISLGAGDVLPPFFGGMGFTVTGRKNLKIIQNPKPGEDDETVIVTLPFDGLNDFLPNFHLKKMLTKLYFSGSSIIEKLSIDVKINGGPPNKFPDPDDIDQLLDNSPSGYESWGNSYNKKEIPGGGNLLEIPTDGTKVELEIQVYIEDKTLTTADFDGGKLLVELIVWLPLEFEANNNAKIIFPEDLFPADEDLFGRSQDDMSITEMIKSLKLDMVFNRNPFKDGDLVITSKNIKFIETLSGNALTIDLNEDRMKDINNPDNWPFAPKFEIDFKKNHVIKFPQELTVVDLAFRAGIKYGMNW